MSTSNAPSGSPPPNATLYVNNLEESIKPAALIEALTELFSEYGTILEIIAKTNLKAKGQAFIVFEDVESATKAIEDIQGFELFGKEMRIAYAKTRSDASVKREGGMRNWRFIRGGDWQRRAAELTLRPTTGPPLANPADLAARPIKATRGAGLKSSNPAAAAVVPDEYLPPNKILFVQNLPEEYDVDMLTSIFGRFEGFREVRLVPGRKGIAFVEYETETGSIGAKENTAGMALGDEQKVIKVTYQRQ
ncbi:putative u1 small nuclear ribonucleoprotein [Botrytis fragariae]|uniref:Putative u1 small nuclear ribonucleoprotein n=1 Tax=Botrytis fragariae TaxID=1964551 RepID=A0A8H6ASR0_9HELO|nr:putative u1 small nuclear ribonucleoprotein [Botrytis fragariae]KAF5872675.1 putative u1 small nuclear ribonucleoprotein [Botrytis fragariae]